MKDNNDSNNNTNKLGRKKNPIIHIPYNQDKTFQRKTEKMLNIMQENKQH